MSGYTATFSPLTQGYGFRKDQVERGPCVPVKSGVLRWQAAGTQQPGEGTSGRAASISPLPQCRSSLALLVSQTPPPDMSLSLPSWCLRLSPAGSALFLPTVNAVLLYGILLRGKSVSKTSMFCLSQSDTSLNRAISGKQFRRNLSS